MFTGIITDIGTIAERQDAGDATFRITTAYAPEGIALGASIACSGICLTVTDRGDNGGLHWFSVTASQETLRVTTARDWKPGTRINLERALKVGDELGGHFVSGHVDGTGTVRAVTPVGDSHRLEVELPENLLPFMAAKGSVTLDGVSLTVNTVEDNRIGLNIIPHTWAHTTLYCAEPGGRLNVEVDVLARYLSRMREVSHV